MAIKVLPDEFAQDDERLRRFQREAKVLASLNHPNIAAIYGLERSGSTHYLVLELVKGETLAERLARGAIPIDEAIEIASKIADALEAAHERGIVHRDLKPANIMLAPDDNVKVLDFGLAKAFVEDAPDAESSMSPTLTRDATRVGVILGTAAYMSPEQAKGKSVDKRADIWAFGAVVFEMLTGARAFTGEDVSDTLAAVLRAEPEWDAVPADVSPAVRTALARCLEKDLKRRVRDIGDVKLAMEGAFESAASRWTADAAPSGGMWQRQGLALAVALALLSGLAVWAWMLTRAPTPARPLARFVVTAPPSPNLFVGSATQHDLALSPDGSRVVYRSGAGGGFNWLYERRLDQLEGTRIEGTQYGTSPFFSPDGAWLGFVLMNELKKIPAAGGTPVTIATLKAGVRGASWGADGTIIFGDRLSRALHRVSAGGGEPEPLLEPGAVNVANVDDTAAFGWPEILPGGNAVLFSIGYAGGNTNTQIAVLNLSSSEVTPLVSLGTYPRYAPTGHIVYGGADATLRAVPFDVDRLQVTGNPVALLDGVMTKGSGATGFDLAKNGSMVYVTGSAQTATRLVWVDRAGREELIETAPKTFDLPRLSPDGRRIAVRIEDRGNVDLYVVEPDRGTVVRLTRAPDVDTSPIWTADGTAIVFGSGRDGGGVFKIAADGAGVVERLAESADGRLPLPHAWSEDGDRIMFYESGGQIIGDIYSLAVESSQVEPLLALPDVMEAHPSLSPDGRWMAYTGNESGRMEIYVRPFPNVDDARVLVSPAGGNEPLWSPDGREIFYWDDATASMMVVPVTLTPTFSAGVATRLFEGNYLFPQAGRHYDVSADGQRFLMIKPETSTDAGSLPDAQIVFVQNWFEELKRLVPADR